MNRNPQRVLESMINAQGGLVVVYWRPGCAYCARLRSKLHRARIQMEEIDIWEDPDGAAFVRSVNGGDETVPTVRVWDKVLVNPSPRLVIDEIRRRGPELIGADPEHRGSRSRLSVFQWVGVVVLIALSLTTDIMGHPSLNWVIDAVAVTWYLVIRTLRRGAGRRQGVLRGHED